MSRSIETIFRLETPKLVAGLARMLRDVGRAEELAQDAMLIAIEAWHEGGIPENPGAWLMTTAKRRALDELRRVKLLERKHDEIRIDTEGLSHTEPDIEAAMDDPWRSLTSEPIDDDLLRLIFVACHPCLPTEGRVALTLRLLGGLTTEEIARAFLVPAPTLAARIVRAKRTLAEKRVPFEVPRGPELHARLASVLEVVYLVFNEGYAASAGDDWVRPALCDDAQRLGRVLCELMPDEPEILGLLALMALQASRTHARIGPGGAPVLLLDQNRALWDGALIARGLAAMERAEGLVVKTGSDGPYLVQAKIAACHARAEVASATDWPKIAALYTKLAELTASPVVELNRAVALGMAFGPEAGLALVDALVNEPVLADYHLVQSVRADLLAKLGRHAEAHVELVKAAAMTRNTKEREMLLARAATEKKAANGT